MEMAMTGKGRAARSFLSIEGQRFGRLIAKDAVVGTKTTKRKWRCDCDCGGSAIVATADLRSGHQTSCGCARADNGRSIGRRNLELGRSPESQRKGGESRVRHGGARRGRQHPLYSRWEGMWDRCTNPNNPKFHLYGGRGITVADRWRDFAAFVADLGMPSKPGLSMDRINNDGNYEPGNVRWATAREQFANSRAAWRRAIG